jgi:hypothetical protein
VSSVTCQYTSAEPGTLDSVSPETDLPLRRRLYPLGFPLDLETNSQDIIEAASEGWGHFSQTFEEAPVRVSLAVVEGDALTQQAGSHFFWREHLMTIFDGPLNVMVCDFRQGFACGSVTRAVAMDHSLVRYRFLMASANTLIEQRALAPLHGALIVRNGIGVMLCGESFAGKSTLAYACSRAGWIYVSDDATFLVRGSQGRCAIGDPHSIRFREDARRFFPELADRLTVVRPNGKPAIEVFTRELPITVASQCSIDNVVLLARQNSGAARLTRYPKAQALEDWKKYAVLGTEDVRAAQLDCHRRLLEAGTWELEYSSLDGAIARLEQLVDSGA